MASHGRLTTGPGASGTCLYHPPARRASAQALGEGLHLREASEPPVGACGFYLWLADDHLELRLPGEANGVWVTQAELARRAAQGGELVRACGGGSARSVLDAMSGWGVDGLVLAARGFQVTLVERHPALHALQRDLVARTGVAGVTCRLGDGFQALQAGGGFDVVYLDPMFPQRRKVALPAKRMQWLASLAPADERPLARWVEAAMASARERVVLKRRRRDPEVLVPNWRIVGRTVRYDVYRGYASCSTA